MFQEYQISVGRLSKTKSKISQKFLDRNAIKQVSKCKLKKYLFGKKKRKRNRRISLLDDFRPYSYSRYWTGTSRQWRLMRGNTINVMNVICI